MARRLVTPAAPPLPVELSHVGAKIARSIEHVKALDSEISRFLDSEPCAVRSEFNAEKRTYTYFAKPIKEVPLSIRILTGEVLGQLRSALDHLAWQLALLTTPKPQPATEFPVFTDGTRYRSERSRKIGSLPKEAQVIIDGLQPHVSDAPEKDQLWRLHRLTNDDKHRLPHIAFTAPAGVWLGKIPAGMGGMSVGFSDEARRGRDFSIEGVFGPFEGDTEICKIIFAAAETDLAIDEAPITFDLAFAVDSAANGFPVRSELMAYGQRVQEIIQRFTGFF